MDHGDDHIFFCEVAVETRAAADELVDFAGDFDAAEACAHNDEAEMAASAFGIAGGFGLFRYSGDDGEVAFGAAGDGYVVVVKARERAAFRFKYNLGGGEVNSYDALGAAFDTGEHLTQWSNSRVDVDGGSGDIREERVEDHVVLAVEEENFTFGSAHLPPEGLCEFYGCKSSTDDDNSHGLPFPVLRPGTVRSSTYPVARSFDA